MNYLRNPFGSRGPPFKVHMFEHDFDRVVNIVLRHPAKETGGNLFGLWTDNVEPVLHIVLGPAIGCTRTEVSFYQSIPYLERVGGLLTEQYQLCHIGEWHSHHRLRLSEPSSGDSSTVIRNFPRGTCGFLLIIANICPSDRKVTLSPYLYKEGQRNYEKGEIEKLHGRSPFLKLDPIYSHMLQDEDTSTTVNEYRPSSRDVHRPTSQSAASHPAVKDEDKNAYVYIFEEDRKMVEEMLLESDTEVGSEGDLFGLWTTAGEPVLHVVLKPSDKKKELQQVPSNGGPPEAKEKGGESLSEEYPSLQKIGKYILHSPWLDKPTTEEVTNFRLEFPHLSVLVVAYPTGDPAGKETSVGLASYIYSNGSVPCQSLEIKSLPGPKVFQQEQKSNDKIKENENKEEGENEKMDVDPQPGSHSPNFEQHT